MNVTASTRFPARRILLVFLLGALPASLEASIRMMWFRDFARMTLHSPDVPMTIPSGGLEAKHIMAQTVNFEQSLRGNFPSHLIYKTFSHPVSGASVRYVDIKHYQSGSAGRCWEYQVEANNATDMILWANTGTASAPVWKKLSDDAADVNPIARLWVQGSVSNGTTRMRLSTYYSNQNVPARLYTADLGAISQSQCELTNYGVLKLVNSTVSLKPGP